MNLAVHFRQKRRCKGILEHRMELWLGVCILLTCLLGVAIFMNSICCGRLHCCSQKFTPLSIRRFAEWISRFSGRRNMLLCHIDWLATNLFGSMESEWKWQTFQSKNSKKHCVPLPASCSFPPTTRTTCPMQRLFLKPGFQKKKT